MGLLHTSRQGRPSLSLDLMEEFHPVVVDAAVTRLIATGQITPAGFDRTADGGRRMTTQALAAFLDAYGRRLLTLVAHRRTATRVSYRVAILAQARTIADWLLAGRRNTRRNRGAGEGETAVYTLLVCYDVGDDDRRDEVSAVLSVQGARVQLSTFECALRTKREVTALRAALKRIIDQDEDQVRIYQLDKAALDSRVILGRRRLEERADFYIG
ncbi:CRISPR-associated endonuclease Cas1 [Amycolatopsis sp. NPDC004378]